MQALPSSHEPLSTTVVFADAALFDVVGSVLAVETATLPVTVVPFPAHQPIFTIIVKLAVAPDPSVAAVQLTAPVPPTAGVEQVQPARALIETNVVFTGTDVVSWTVDAVPGPLFVTPIA